MRDYGKVYTAFWTSQDVRAMSEDGRSLAIYLLTCTHGNMLGCFRLTNAYAADDLQWTVERVSKGFEELLSKGFAYRCERSFWLVIRQYLKWNQFENPNVGKAAGKLFSSLASPDHVKSLLANSLREYSEWFPPEIISNFHEKTEPFPNPFETLSKTGTGVVAVVGTPAKPEPVAPQCVAAPKKSNEDSPKKQACRATWDSYCYAYFNRYGTEPVRNAKVNGQIANIVDRLGAEEAPAVAAFYVSHNNSFYVRNMHSVGFLQSDCEKLRTEWATNSRMTSTRANQVDKTQTTMDAFGPLIEAARAREAAQGGENA